MKKIVNWTFGSVFRTFGRVIAYILLGLLASVFISKLGIKIPSLGIYRVNASTTIGSNSGYSVLACINDNNKCTSPQSTGKIAYGTSTSDLGLTISGVLSQSNNLIYSTFQNGYTYTISFRTHFGGLGNKINLIKNDLSDWRFYIAGYNNDNTGFSDSYITSASCSTRFDNTTSNGFITTCNVGVNSNLSRIRIETYFWDTSVWYPSAYSDPWGSITSVRTDFIDLTESEGVNATINNSTNNIINNQNQNSQNIINNQNENTNKIVDELSTKCPNLYNGSTHTDANLKVALDLSNLTTGKTYTISSDLPIYVAKFSQRNAGSSGSDTGPEKWASAGFKSWTFEYTGNKYLYLDLTSSAGSHFITNISEINLYHIMVVEGSDSKPYCKYGTTTNKIDNLNDNIGHISGGIHDLQDSINDDNISDSDIESKLNYNVSNASQGPFASFLTLPLTWVQTLLNANVCSSLHVPLPFLDNKYLDLPCMDGFWESLGGLEFIITLVWYAVIGVRIFNGLFLLVVETTSAHDNDDYLTKIKSWEL